MPNNYFHFKEFTIHQDRCAMKVCTDACLFGAIAANDQRPTTNGQQQTTNVLDIGSGTGLLSLMYAQKNPDAFIDAVEINAEAARQAKENFIASPWAGRLNLIHEDIWVLETEKKYDLILSNPPFFEGDLQTADEAKNAAKHNSTLDLLQLLKRIIELLAVDGRVALLLPYHRVNYIQEEAEKLGLHLTRNILVKQSPGHGYFRGILFYSKEKCEVKITEITIRKGEGVYSDEFIDLLKEYYLDVGKKVR
jgi:tRNA1Val (adenine37-N6)-methyltransferase